MGRAFGEGTSKSERCVGFWCVCGRETRRAAALRSKRAWEAARPAARRRGVVSVCAYFDELPSHNQESAAERPARASVRSRRPRGCAEAALRSRRVRAPPVGSKSHKVRFESQGLYHTRARRASAARGGYRSRMC